MSGIVFMIQISVSDGLTGRIQKLYIAYIAQLVSNDIKVYFTNFPLDQKNLINISSYSKVK